MKRLILTAALLMLFSAVAFAQQNPAPANATPPIVGSRIEVEPTMVPRPAAQCPTHAVAAACPADAVMRMMLPTGGYANEIGATFTSDQQPKAEAIRGDYQKKLDDANSRVESADWVLMNALASQKVDAAKLPELMAAAAKADADAMRIRVDYWLELKSLLTPEQDKQVSLWLQKRLMPALDTNRPGGMGYGGYRGGY